MELLNEIELYVIAVVSLPILTYYLLADRAVRDTLKVVRMTLNNPSSGFVHGAGCFESQLMNLVQDYITSNQLENTVEAQVFKSFAKSLEVIPKTIITNALPVFNETVLNETLYKLHSQNNLDLKQPVGINRVNCSLTPMSNKDELVVDSLLVKLNVIQTAVDTTCALLKVDSVQTQSLLPREIKRHNLL
jgi:chaperonin GroEL (HSP60 family)